MREDWRYKTLHERGAISEEDFQRATLRGLWIRPLWQTTHPELEELERQIERWATENPAKFRQFEELRREYEKQLLRAEAPPSRLQKILAKLRLCEFCRHRAHAKENEPA